MSSETENENRRRLDKLEGDFEKSETERKSDKAVQEANMKTLEATMRELVAENRAAFEKSLSETKIAFQGMLTTMEQNSKRQMAFTAMVVGVAAAALGVLLIWPVGGG